jgi:hypothetical protein
MPPSLLLCYRLQSDKVTALELQLREDCDGAPSAALGAFQLSAILSQSFSFSLALCFIFIV